MMNMATAQAAIVGTTDVLTDTKRAQLVRELEREDIQQQLIEMGVDPESAAKRIGNMTDEELTQLDGQLSALPAGAGFSNVELLLIIIIIILIL
jgi:hypothetical protein